MPFSENKTELQCEPLVGPSSPPDAILEAIKCLSSFTVATADSAAIFAGGACSRQVEPDRHPLGLAQQPLVLWIEYLPIQPDGSVDLDLRDMVQQGFRDVLLPRGLSETGSGSWLHSGLSDISFRIPPATDLDALRAALDGLQVGFDWGYIVEPES